MWWATGGSAVWITAASASSVSLVASVVMLIAFARLPELREFPARLSFVVSGIDLVWMISSLVSIGYLAMAHDTESSVADVCAWLGPAQQACALGSIGWSTVIATNLRRMAALPDESLLLPREREYHLVLWSAVFICVLATVVANTGVTPFISRYEVFSATPFGVCYLNRKFPVLRLAVQSIPALIAVVYNASTFVWAWRHVPEYFPANRAAVIRKRVYVRSILYILGFVAIWLPVMVDDWLLFAWSRGWSGAEAGTSLVYRILVAKAVLFFGQGVINSVVHSANKWIVMRHMCDRDPSRAEPFLRRPSVGPRRRFSRSTGKRSRARHQRRVSETARLMDRLVSPQPQDRSYGSTRRSTDWGSMDTRWGTLSFASADDLRASRANVNPSTAAGVHVTPAEPVNE